VVSETSGKAVICFDRYGGGLLSTTISSLAGIRFTGIDIIASSGYNWAMSIELQKCLRCGYEWYPRTPQLPKKCPRCHNPYWNKPKVKQSGPRKGVEKQ
jgi:hypothetical protein